jgi:hypothetical protein
MATPISRTPRLEALSGGQLDRLRQVGRRVGFVKGQVVFVEGLPANQTILLLEGRLSMTGGSSGCSWMNAGNRVRLSAG